MPTSAEMDDLQLVREEWDRFADEYDDYYSGDEIERENECIARLVRDHAHGSRVIDLGCGTAQITEYVDFGHYTGVDISAEMVSEARHRPNTRYIVDDYRELPPADFDAAISVFGGCGFVPPRDTFNAVRRLLTAGGSFLLMFPTPAIRERDYYPVDDLDAMVTVTPDALRESAPAALSLEEIWRFQPLGDGPLLARNGAEQHQDSYGDYTYLVVEGHA